MIPIGYDGEEGAVGEIVVSVGLENYVDRSTAPRTPDYPSLKLK